MKLSSILIWAEILLLSSSSCSTPPTLTLATTTSAYDSGLLNALIPPFEQAYGIKVKVVAVGSGQALELGRRGDADVLLVHAPEKEKEFMEQGYGSERRQVMANDFVLVGPAEDPAGIKGLGIKEALQKIFDQGALFISRGDESGTHLKERELWQKAGIAPSGIWYLSAGQGMANTLIMASEKRAYTLSDRATFLMLKPKLKLVLLVEGDKELFNPYSVIAVNPQKVPGVKYKLALKLISYLTSPQAQQIIKNFGSDKYQEPLFVPLS